MSNRAVLIFLLVVLSTPFAKADVEVIGTDFIPNLNGSWCDIRISGEIAEPDAAALDALECARASIYLRDSPGGDIDAAMRIGRWARERDAFISVIVDAYCFSSCVLVYVGGVNRSNFGKIGLHRPYLAGAPMTDVEVEAFVPRMLEQIRDYAHEMRISPEFVSAMINTPPSEVRMFERDKIYELVAKTDTIYDELQVARDARNYGVTTDEYRRRNVEAEQNCTATRLGFSRYLKLDSPELKAYSSASYNCKEAILWGVSVSVYKKRYVDADERCAWPNSSSEDEARECFIQVMRGSR